ncbi:MAG: transcriptional regulator [Actinomycetales bacterium]|nr:MAG: transcriptional regulator [Actinomycetales bacterium]
MTLQTDPHDVGAVPPVAPVGTLQDVLQALADPVRLEMVRRLAADDGPVRCSALYEGVSKSTASHHFKTLREAGITERSYVDGVVHHTLRRDDLEDALPGVVTSIVTALD